MNARSCLRGIGSGEPDLEELKAGLLDVVEASQRAEEVIQRNRRLFRDKTVEVVPLDINAVIRETVVLAAARLRDSQVTLITALADNLPAVSGDRIELQQVLLNLIDNAVDALDEVAAERVASKCRHLLPRTSRWWYCSGGRGQWRRIGARRRAADVHARLHHQSQGDGRRPLNQPVNHRRPPRPAVGRTESVGRRSLSLHRAGPDARRPGASGAARTRASRRI